MAGEPKRRVVVFGVGDFARIARYYLTHDSPYEVVAHTVTADSSAASEFLGLPVVPFERIAEAYPPAEAGMFVAIAYSRVNRSRREIFERARALGYPMVRYVCSKATTWPDLSIGDGTFVFENNVVQPYVQIGEDTVLWSGNHIGHDSRIGSHVFIASHAVVSGNCRIGDGTFVGVNATIRDGVTIGAECVIGAGAIVLRDVPDGAVLKAVATPVSDITSAMLRKI
jgi:sugar O-acyltransferase (sialic acid O-acetyltransferase NeuD family)